MIYESREWKRELKSELYKFKRYISSTKNTTESTLVSALIKTQKFLFYTSFLVRKLIEAKKISDELMSKCYKVKKFNKRVPEKITLCNGYEIDRLYDLKKSNNEFLSIRSLCNYFIHSFIVIPEYGWQKSQNTKGKRKKLKGVFFNSDNNKEQSIFYILISAYIELIENVISDYIVHMKVFKGAIVKRSSISISR